MRFVFKGISTILGYLMPNPSLYKNISGTNLTHSWEDKGVHTFPKGIFLNMIVIAQLEFELT